MKQEWKHRFRFVLVLICVFSSGPAISSAAAPKEYAFRVLLDDKEIGSQSFLVSEDTDQTRIDIKASFDVKFLFFTAYTYRHANQEIWGKECLREIKATTDDNGEKTFVRGKVSSGKLQLETHAGARAVEGCIRTFAYWSRDLVENPRLLNSQTGELQTVQVKQQGEEPLSVRGVPTPAERIKLITDDFTIDLWYSKKREWVGLQTTTKKGNILKYQLL